MHNIVASAATTPIGLGRKGSWEATSPSALGRVLKLVSLRSQLGKAIESLPIGFFVYSATGTTSL
jgi:hypothetical protein